MYRTGPYAPNGIPFADGYVDYLAMINERDGGINGVKILTEECETGYLTDRGVECYERLKNKGPTGAAVFNPLSTGITYALIERAPTDRIPIVSMGYGRADSADGRVFPWVFPILGTYWTQADTLIHYVATQEGGYDKLKGKKIAFIYHDSPYGKEPIPVFQALAKQYGFELEMLPGHPPGPGAEVDLAADRAAVPARLDVHVGLGGDELHRDQGGGGDRLPARSLHRRVVVGRRA